LDYKILKDLRIIASCLIGLKLLAIGLTASEALGAFVVLASIQATKIIDHRFPRLPDVFKEIEIMKDQMTRIDAMERDLTAIKLGAMRR